MDTVLKVMTAINSFPQLNLQYWPYYLLVLVRSSGFFVLSPIFGRRNLPVRFRLGLALILSVMFIQLYPPAEIFTSEPSITYVLLVIGEVLVGLIIGYITIVFFALPAIAGQIIDIQLGIGMGAVFDPSMGTQTTYSGMLLNIVMTVYFFTLDGHLKLIRILGLTYERIPVGEVRLNPVLPTVAMEAFFLMVMLAVTLALPIIASALVSEVTMGVLMRAVPNFHAYMVGIPLKIIIGLVVLFAMQPFYLNFLDNVFNEMFQATENMIAGLGG
ncbi:MAG: flagellar biosynthesis protein FliR [Clostridiales bacterium]|jgi:flagellar biosynthetic protein FliR|nr:flagellar biosynthesis protein FliR [Clostridiales bacterium]